MICDSDGIGLYFYVELAAYLGLRVGLTLLFKGKYESFIETIGEGNVNTAGTYDSIFRSRALTGQASTSKGRHTCSVKFAFSLQGSLYLFMGGGGRRLMPPFLKLSECPSPIDFNGVKRDFGQTIDAFSAYITTYIFDGL